MLKSSLKWSHLSSKTRFFLFQINQIRFFLLPFFDVHMKMKMFLFRSGLRHDDGRLSHRHLLFGHHRVDVVLPDCFFYKAARTAVGRLQSVNSTHSHTHTLTHSHTHTLTHSLSELTQKVMAWPEYCDQISLLNWLNRKLMNWLN